MPGKKVDLKRILQPVGDITRRLKDRHNQLITEVEVLDEQLGRYDGRSGRLRKAGPTGTTSFADSPGRKCKRKRHSRGELDALAQEIVKFIDGKGKDGIIGKEIVVQFGPPLPSVNAWLKMYSPAKIKTMGAKLKM